MKSTQISAGFKLNHNNNHDQEHVKYEKQIISCRTLIIEYFTLSLTWHPFSHITINNEPN